MNKQRKLTQLTNRTQTTNIFPANSFIQQQNIIKNSIGSNQFTYRIPIDKQHIQTTGKRIERELKQAPKITSTMKNPFSIWNICKH